jgi:hypothetical protein
MREAVRKTLGENVGISFDKILVEFGEILISTDGVRWHDAVKLSEVFLELDGSQFVELL